MQKERFLFDIDPKLLSRQKERDVVEFAQRELQAALDCILADGIAGYRIEFLYDETLRFDGYQIRSGGRKLCITARMPRGILHGSYEALRLMGCDFTFPGAQRQYIPHNARKTFPACSVCREPWLEYRGLCLYNTTAATLPQTLETVDWMAKNGFNFLLTSIHRLDDTGQGDHAILWDEIEAEILPQLEKRGIVVDMSEHSTDYYFPKEELFRQHLEWFALQQGERSAGQICYANRQAVEAYAESLVRFVKDKKEFQFFGIWPLDGGGYCECSACKDPLTIYKANRYIAGKIHEVRPDLTVEHLAYTPQSFARPQSSMPDNMSVLVCSVQDRIAYEWACRAQAGGAFYFDYNTADHYRWRAQLWLNPYHCKQMVNTMAAYGYRGIVSLYLPVTCWWQAGINCWYLRHFYYDPSAQIPALTKKLAAVLFGSRQAEKMQQLLLRIYDELQAPDLWSRDPFAFPGFGEHITNRSRMLDALHRRRYEEVFGQVMQRLEKLMSSSTGKNEHMIHLRDYLRLQKAYYTQIDQFDADSDLPEQAEEYFQLLADINRKEDSPFISVRYARWRIAGRDNILQPDLTNEFQAAAEK